MLCLEGEKLLTGFPDDADPAFYFSNHAHALPPEFAGFYCHLPVEAQALPIRGAVPEASHGFLVPLPGNTVYCELSHLMVFLFCSSC